MHDSIEAMIQTAGEYAKYMLVAHWNPNLQAVPTFFVMTGEQTEIFCCKGNAQREIAQEYW